MVTAVKLCVFKFLKLPLKKKNKEMSSNSKCEKNGNYFDRDGYLIPPLPDLASSKASKASKAFIDFS